MNEYLLNTLLVLIAVLIGIIAGLVACVMARKMGQIWPAAFCYAAGVFAAAVVFVLVVKDHVLPG